jgi:hypothetical protein
LTTAVDLHVQQSIEKADSVLKEQISSDAMCSITFDGGQAKNKQQFLAVTVHWMMAETAGANLKLLLKQTVLGCVAFPGKHRAIQVQDKVVETVTGRGIAMNSVICAIHDGAPNMSLADYANIMELDCVLHGSQLVMVDMYGRKKKLIPGALKNKEDMSDFEALRDPGHQLAMSFRYSALKRDLLAKVQTAAGVDRPKTIFVAPDHRWNYDYLELRRLDLLYPHISAVDVTEISDSSSDRLEYLELKAAYEGVREELREVLPVLEGVAKFGDFCNLSIVQPVLSRLGMALSALKGSATPLRSSVHQRVRRIGLKFEESVERRFAPWLSSKLFLVAQFLDPYVAHKMTKENFLKARTDVLDMIPDEPGIGADDDMFAVAGAAPFVDLKITEMTRYVTLARHIKEMNLADDKLPSSVSFWEAHGLEMKKILRVYQNIGSVLLASTPSEAVFNQLALTVNDRRGSLDPARAAGLTLSAVLAKQHQAECVRSFAELSTIGEDELDIFAEKLDEEAEREGVIASKYVDIDDNEEV